MTAKHSNTENFWKKHCMAVPALIKSETTDNLLNMSDGAAKNLKVSCIVAISLRQGTYLIIIISGRLQPALAVRR